MDKRNGHPSPHANFDIPLIVVTDHSDDSANQQNVLEPAQPAENRQISPTEKVLEALAEAHADYSEVYVNEDGTTVGKIRIINECYMPETSSEEEEFSPDFAANGKMADVVTKRSSILNLKRPTVSSVQQPPGVLPDVSDVLKKGASNSAEPDYLFKFPALGPMSFSVNRDESLPINQLKDNGAERLDESESLYSSCLSASAEQPPQCWKLLRETSEKPDGGRNDDLSEIINTYDVIDYAALDDNAPPAPANDSENVNSSTNK